MSPLFSQLPSKLCFLSFSCYQHNVAPSSNSPPAATHSTQKASLMTVDDWHAHYRTPDQALEGESHLTAAAAREHKPRIPAERAASCFYSKSGVASSRCGFCLTKNGWMVLLLGKLSLRIIFGGRFCASLLAAALPVSSISSTVVCSPVGRPCSTGYLVPCPLRVVRVKWLFSLLNK